MKMIKNILVAGMSIISIISFAQSEKTVPENAALTICLNGKNIQKQMSVSEIEKLAFIKDLKREISSEKSSNTSLKKMGIDYSKNAYFSVDKSDSATVIMFSLPLTSSKFLIKELAKDGGNVRIKNSKYTVFRDYRNAFVISKNQLLFVDYNIERHYNTKYYQDAVEEAFEERSEEEERPVYKDENGKEISKWEWDRIQEFQTTLKYALDRMAGKNAKKNLKSSSNAPIYAWFNGGFLQNLNFNRGFGYYGRRSNPFNEIQEDLHKKFGNASTFMELNIDKNGGVLSFESEFSDEMKKMFDEVYDHKLDAELLKYIPADAIGYSTYAMNAKGLYNQYKKILTDFKSDNEDVQMIQDIWSIVDLALDEDAIFETIKGDAVIAYNGIEEVEFTKMRWEYDEESFEEKRVEVISKDDFPVFTAAFSIGNKEIYEKIFRIISRNERDFQLREDGSWVAKDRKLQTYFYLTDKALIVTNGTDFDHRTAKNGYVKSMVSNQTELEKSPVNLYFDFTRLMKDLPADEFRNRDKVMLDAAKKYQAEIKLLPIEIDGSNWKTSICINTGGRKGNNGVQHFMNFVNDMFIANQNYRSNKRSSIDRPKERSKEQLMEEAIERAVEGAVEKVEK